MPSSPKNSPIPNIEDKEKVVRSMFDSIAPRYDFLNRLLTFGMDLAWRKKTVRSLDLKPGAVTIDIACGTGDLCRELKKVQAEPIGIDISFGMLHSSKTDAPLIHGDALNIPLPDKSIDAVTCGFALRNFVDIKSFFTETSRVLKKNGRIAVLEVDTPRNKLIGLGHSFYFKKIVPSIGGLISNRAAYKYLPRSVVYLPEKDELFKLIESSGFVEINKTQLSGGIAQLITAKKL